MKKLTVSMHTPERDPRSRLLILHNAQGQNAEIVVPYDKLSSLPSVLLSTMYLRPAVSHLLGFDPTEILSKDDRRTCELESLRLMNLVLGYGEA